MEELTKKIRYLYGDSNNYFKEQQKGNKEHIWANDKNFGIQIISDAISVEIKIINVLFNLSIIKDKVSSIRKEDNVLVFNLGRFENNYNRMIDYIPLANKDYIFEITEYKREKRIEI